ncbi:MAG TPA: glycosyltransferase family 39 protein [Roseiflexaceae bacterium]|nr:glycosyltransferase family 39 protein [Roseiflexaceae bacterium]
MIAQPPPTRQVPPLAAEPALAAGRLRQSLPLLLILLLALALRLALWSQPLHQPANDEIEYVTVARDLLAGRGWQLYERFEWLRGPGYPLFLAGSLWLAGGDLHRAALPGLLLSVANVYLGYRLALRLAGRSAALLAALLAAVLWTSATFASLYMAETLWVFLFTGGLLALLGVDDRPRVAWGRLALAGALLGLATLTRSITLLFLPLAGLWLLARPLAGGLPAGRPLASALRRWPLVAAFALCAALVIAPWTLRNYLAYGRLIPVETGLAYNVWVFNEPREDIDTISNTLIGIPNPAERSDYAMQKGLARLREDPAILLRKLWPNWIYLWRVKPIQDRFLQTFYYADVQLPLFVAALVFDDALYLLIALAAVAGLLRRPGSADPARRAARWLCLVWLAYTVATVLLTHGESRYRHFLFPVLIPYAALAVGAGGWGLRAGGTKQEPSTRNSKLKTQTSKLILQGLLLYTVLSTYPWEWAGKNLARGWQVAAGDLAWALGRTEAAQQAYGRALAADPTPDGWLRVAALARARGDLDRVATAYRRASGMVPLYIVPSTLLGDLLRAQGDPDGARRAFAGSYASAQEVADWSWASLDPPPRTHVDVGDGLDFGYVSGMDPAEEQQGATARWTGGRGLLRLNVPAGAPAVLELRLAAPHPGGRPVAAEVCAARCWPLKLTPTWRVYTLPLPSAAGPLLVEIRSDTFATPDGRRLGALVDTVAVK